MKIKTSILVKISLLAALGFILQFFSMPLPFFPPFLKIDVADSPAIIGAITLGPIPAVAIQLIKNVLQGITNSENAGVGEFANFLMGSALVMPIGLVCRKNKSIKNYVIGSVLGIISMIIAACFLNFYVLVPMYISVMGMTEEGIITICQAVNPYITDLKAYIFIGIAPFNLIKGTFITGLSYLLYKLLYKPLMRYFVEE